MLSYTFLIQLMNYESTDSMIENHIKIMIAQLPFSICWRKFVKLKYAKNPLYTKQSFQKCIYHNIFLFAFCFCVIFFLLSFVGKYHFVTNDIIFYGSNHKNNLHKPNVYEVISSWSLNSDRDIANLPLLSSLRDNQWLQYSKSELFEWTKVQNHDIHEHLRILPSLDSKRENASYGDLGAPIVFKDDLLIESKSKMSLYQLNVVASDVMSLNRRLNDMRPSR